MKARKVVGCRENKRGVLKPRCERFVNRRARRLAFIIREAWSDEEAKAKGDEQEESISKPTRFILSVS